MRQLKLGAKRTRGEAVSDGPKQTQKSWKKAWYKRLHPRNRRERGGTQRSQGFHESQEKGSLGEDTGYSSDDDPDRITEWSLAKTVLVLETDDEADGDDATAAAAAAADEEDAAATGPTSATDTADSSSSSSSMDAAVHFSCVCLMAACLLSL